MESEVIELGNRPAVLSRARLYAPSAARELGILLGKQEFADIGFVVLDWTNALGQVPGETSKPILHVRVRKRLPEYERANVLTVDIRLDVDDVFAGDELTAEVLVELVQELKNKVDEQVALRRNQ